MKNNILILILVLFMGCQEEGPVIAQNLADSNLDVILVIGQSNTHYGLGLDTELDAPHGRVYQLGRFGGDNNVVVAATEPLQHHTMQNNKIGFALSFAKQYTQDFLASDSERNTIIIPGGWGGTGFGNNRWNKGDDLYEDAVQRTHFVLESFPGSRLVAILWHQGESDVGNPSYQSSLDQFIGDLRLDLDAAEIPFILGGMVPYWVNQGTDRIAQQAIISGTVDRIALTGYADPTIPFVIEKPDNNFDNIHFDAAGQREIACRYYWEYERLVE